jgi:hypothetical protein
MGTPAPAEVPPPDGGRNGVGDVDLATPGLPAAATAGILTRTRELAGADVRCADRPRPAAAGQTVSGTRRWASSRSNSATSRISIPIR